MTLFNQKYHIKSNRLSEWDYTEVGYYFVTICTHRLECLLGHINNRQMHLSLIGEIVREELLKTESIRKNVQLDEWVIMPNHLHAIIVIKSAPVETTRRVVSTSLPPNSLGSIIGQFKSICTKRVCAIEMRRGLISTIWQCNYYDHIIRNDQSLHKIRKYIQNNPVQ